MSTSYQTSGEAASQTRSRSGAARRIRGIVFTALFAALFIAFSSISIPLGFTPIPITLQTLAVMLAGGLLGAAYGFASIAIVILLAFTGLPLIHGLGGLSLLLGTSAGFIWAFPIAALLIGLVSDRLFRGGGKPGVWQTVILAASIVVFGIFFVDASGMLWMMHKVNFSVKEAFLQGCYPFLFGDTVKMIVAVLLIRTLRPQLPSLGASRNQLGNASRSDSLR